MTSDCRKINGAGFTLIELIIYLGLFTLLMGGVIVTAYNVFESSGRNETKAMLGEEGAFLTAKISWVLSGAQTINSPATSTPGSVLSVTKYDGSGATISQNGTDMQIQDTLGTSILNNSNVSLNTMLFTHAASSGDGINPESILTTFTLTTLTPGGMTISQTFSKTNYLRR